MTVNEFYYTLPGDVGIPSKENAWYIERVDHRIIVTPEYRKYLTDFMSYKKGKRFNMFDVSVVFPCMDVEGYVNGIVVRSLVQKSFYGYVEFPVMLWGMENFKGFKYGDPIVLVEGIKDATVVRKKYPYVLSYLTSGVGKYKWEFLRKMTDKFLVIPDNDKAGREFGERLHGVMVQYPVHKDVGQYVEKKDKLGLKHFFALLEMNLKCLGSGYNFDYLGV